jgi:hypothetical protein
MKLRYIPSEGLIMLLRLVPTVLKLAAFVAVLVILFTGLMFAAKIWGVYSIPPSNEDSGGTWIITRYEDEPFLNAPDRPTPPPPEEEEQRPQRRGITGGGEFRKQPIEERIVMAFPYVRWIHEQAIDTTATP